MILTRYLYPKHNVIYSLYVSLAFVDIHQSLFWAYELYFSGFRTETVDLLLQIYDDYYKNEPIKPILQKWLEKTTKKWQENMQSEIIETIIKNIICREPDFIKFQEKIPEFKKSDSSNIVYIQKPIFIVVKQTTEQYLTKLAEYSKGWKLPRLVCQYISYCDPIKPLITINDYIIVNNCIKWLYNASGSPIWKTRIIENGGKIDNIEKCIKFSSEEIEEEFMNKFSMEPDEQPLEIQAAWFGEPL